MKRALMLVGSFVVIAGIIGAYVMQPIERDALESYREKQDFSKTNEPEPGQESKGSVKKSGEKPEGAYVLIKTKGMGDNKRLFCKMKDEHAAEGGDIKPSPQ